MTSSSSGFFSQPPLPIYLVGAEFHRERSTFEERIVRLNGRNVNDFASSEALQGEARRTLKEVIERLRLIVDDTSSNEPALLAFFKTNPVATVLLEPETERQWREEAIQDYGQIDFVLELVDGTFRVVEIESATRESFTAKNEFTHSTQHAIEQTRKWIRGASKAPNTINNRFRRQPHATELCPLKTLAKRINQVSV